jgi:hypothetical protein
MPGILADHSSQTACRSSHYHAILIMGLPRRRTRFPRRQSLRGAGQEQPEQRQEQQRFSVGRRPSRSAPRRCICRCIPPAAAVMRVSAAVSQAR